MLKTDTYLSTETQEKIKLLIQKAQNGSIDTNYFMDIEDILYNEVYHKQPSEPKNILLIKLDEIGDSIMASSSVRNVRKTYPNAEITILCQPLTKQLYKKCPYINRIICCEKKVFIGKLMTKACDTIFNMVSQKLLQYKFDTVITLRHNSDCITEAFIAFFTGAVRRYSLDLNSNRYCLPINPLCDTISNVLLSKVFVVPPDVIHEADKQIYLMKRLHMFHSGELELFYSKSDNVRAKQWLAILPGNSQKIVVGITAGINRRKWPVKRYLLVCKYLLKKYNVSFVILGSDREKDDAEFLEANLPKGKILNLCCKTTLSETAAVISNVDFYIGNDTGLLHMASAAKIPVVGLYVDPLRQDKFPSACPVKLFAPYKTKAVILRPDKPTGECATEHFIWGGCKHLNEPHCILAITVNKVIEAFETLRKM